MPDGLDDLIDDSNPGSGQSNGGQLRKQLEEVLAQNKALTERLAAQDAAARQSNVASLFAKHSVPDLAKDFFPKDADPTDEAVTSFIERYGQLWGATAAPATTPPDQQAATAAAQQFTSVAGQAPVAPLSEDQYRAKLAEAKSPEQLSQLIDQLSMTAVAGPGA